jgi:hypothetical protein
MDLQAAVHLGHMPWALTKEEEACQFVGNSSLNSYYNEMFQTKVLEKIKHVLCSKNRGVCGKIWYCTSRQATDDNMERAHCMLDN